MITTKKYEDRLLRIARLFDAAIEDIQIVPSIKEWCSNHGITESRDDRVGKCVLNQSTGKHLILIAAVIYDDTKESIISYMSCQGSSSKELQSLAHEWRFVKHLLLHECAHAFNSKFSERECDSWAFDKMKEIDI